MSDAMRSRAWCFTWNNPAAEPAWECRYIVYQKEVGESGTPHWQGYCLFDGVMRLAALKKLCPEAHWSVRRTKHEDCVKYCTKEETRVPGTAPVIRGDPPVPGTRNDLHAVCEAVIDRKRRLVDVEAENLGIFARYGRSLKMIRADLMSKRDWKTRVVVLVGPTECGKSRWAHDTFPEAYTKSATKWFDGYDGQEVAILDEFYGQIPYSEMLKLMDRYPMLVETKGGHVQWSAKLLIVTSNTSPEEWYHIDHDWKPPFMRRLDLVFIFDPKDGWVKRPDYMTVGPVEMACLARKFLDP